MGEVVVLPATGWLGTGVAHEIDLLPMTLPAPLIGKYRDPSPLDPVPGGSSFPFTARISGGHEVTTELGADVNGDLSTLTKLSLLEVFGAVLVDILEMPGWLPCDARPVSAWFPDPLPRP